MCKQNYQWSYSYSYGTASTSYQKNGTYFQVFKLDVANGKQHIHHFSEQPEYSKEYMIDLDNPVNQKVYVIDDTDHSTMLLAEEY